MSFNFFIFRVQFIQDYTLKSMRLKPDKWAKLVISDEQRRHLEHFIEKGIGFAVYFITYALVLSKP